MVVLHRTPGAHSPAPMFPPGVPGRHCPFLKKENPQFLVPLTPSPVSPSLPFLVATGSGSNRANPTGMVQIVQPPWELETNRRSSMPGQGGWVAARGRGPGKTIGAPGVGSSPCPTGLGFTLQTWPEGGPCTAKPSPQEPSLHVCGFWEPVYKLASFLHRFRAFLGQMRSKCCK